MWLTRVESAKVNTVRRIRLVDPIVAPVIAAGRFKYSAIQVRRMLLASFHLASPVEHCLVFIVELLSIWIGFNHKFGRMRYNSIPQTLAI